MMMCLNFRFFVENHLIKYEICEKSPYIFFFMQKQTLNKKFLVRTNLILYFDHYN